MKRAILMTAALTLSAALVRATDAPPEKRRIEEAVERLGENDFRTRQKAFDQLEAWGAEHPEVVLAALPAESTDHEIQLQIDVLKKRLTMSPAERELIRQAAGNEALKQTFKTLFGAPTAEEVEACEDALFGVPETGEEREVAARAMEHYFRKSGNQAFIEAIRDFGCPSSVPFFVQLLSGPDPKLADAAARALSSCFRSEDALPEIAPLLDSPDLPLARRAADIIGQRVVHSGILLVKGDDRIGAARKWWEKSLGDLESALVPPEQTGRPGGRIMKGVPAAATPMGGGAMRLMTPPPAPAADEQDE